MAIEGKFTRMVDKELAYWFAKVLDNTAILPNRFSLDYLMDLISNPIYNHDNCFYDFH